MNGDVDASAARVREIFFLIHDGLPREAPGDDASARRALAALDGLPPDPLVLDLGCGPGAATAMLARETGGRVIGLDLHGPFLHDVRRRALEADLGSRVLPVHGDMASPPFATGTFDLVWSEGALYSIGFGRGLGVARDLLRPGGQLVATEAVWLDPDPPPEVRRWWEGEYPAISSVDATLDVIASAGLSLLGHFTLPASAWWEYYDPMEVRLEELDRRFAGEAAALAALQEARSEIDMYRRFGWSYGYELVICRRP